MRFLAIVSVFFAVTQVAFAAPVFRASELTTREPSKSDLVTSVVNGHYLLKNHPDVIGDSAPVKLPAINSIATNSLGQHTVETDDGATHHIVPTPLLKHSDGSHTTSVIHRVITPDPNTPETPPTVDQLTQTIKSDREGQTTERRVAHHGATHPDRTRTPGLGTFDIPPTKAERSRL
ncbi:hypothetical protein K439DRAFT_1663273 [Ramaria rubella]|nr:hypothetical protein K439DRAFT_1663273 [Ramaria rubella]